MMELRKGVEEQEEILRRGTFVRAPQPEEQGR